MVKQLLDSVKSLSEHEVQTLWMFSIKQIVKTLRYGHV